MEGQVQLRPVDAEEFRSLATSRRNLVRRDDEAQGLRGLLDPVEQVWYVIREDQLLALVQSEAERPGQPA